MATNKKELLTEALGSIKSCVYELSDGQYLITVRDKTPVQRAASAVEAYGAKVRMPKRAKAASFVAWWLAVCLVALLALPALFPGAAVAASETTGDPYVAQLVEEGGEGFSSLEEFESVIAQFLISTIRFLQGISSLVILLGVFISVGILFLGGIFGSRSMRGAGVTGILGAIGAYLLIRNAPAVILTIQNLSVQ